MKLLKSKKCTSITAGKRVLAGVLTTALVVGNLTLPTNISIGRVDFGAVFAQAAETVDSGTCGDNLTWVLDDEGTLTISGSGEMKYCSWSDYSDNIVSVIIEDGATSICYNAFNGCTSLTSIEIPDSVTSIESYIFHDCTSLVSIEIPDNVTEIGSYAFKDCTSLTDIEISLDKISLGTHVFGGCIGLADENGFIIFDNIVYDYCGEDTEIQIPDGVTGIAAGSFSGYSDLTKVEIPDSVTSIADDAFCYCSGLADENGFVCIWNANAGNILFDYFGHDSEVEIYDGVTSIGSFAFSYNHSFTSIKIPDSVTSIGAGAFSYSDLKSVSIPDSVTSIGAGAFFECYSLTDVEIPNSVTYIAWGMFWDCRSLTSITISNSVTCIRDEAFRGCDSLSDVYFYGSEEEWNAIEIGEYNECLTSATIHYIILSYDLSECDVTLEYDTATYTGSALEPTVKVKGLREGKDYTFSYENNIDAGTATVTVTGIGNNTGSYVTSFEITKVDQSVDASIETESIAYGGTSQITATGVGTVTYSSSDESVATVSEAGLVTAVSAGNATITITAAGDSNTNSSSTTINVTVEEEVITYVLGDINEDGFIDYLDAMTALRYDAELVTLSGDQLLAGDVNGDGSVDSLDAILILRYDAGLVASFES